MGDEINLMNESDDISLLSAEYTLDKNFKVYANAAYLTYNFSFVDVSQKKISIEQTNSTKGP